MNASLPLKYIANVVAGQSPPSEFTNPLNSGLPFLQGNAEFGRETPLAKLECDAAPKVCKTGDILLSVRAPVGDLNIADQSYGIGRGLAAIRSERCDSRFMWWWLHGQIAYLNSIATGSTYVAVTAEDVASLRFPVMSIEEQRRIANYLDIEIARIVKVEDLQRRAKSLVRVRRWSMLDEILRRTRTVDVPIRRMLRFITDGPFGSAFSSADYVDEGAAVVRLGNIGFDEYKGVSQAYIPMDLYRGFYRYRVREGDVLVAGLGDANNHPGRACVAPDLGPAIVKGKCFCLRVDEDLVLGKFLSLMLSSSWGKQSLGSRGSTRSMINLEIVKAAIMPLPTVFDQKMITREMERVSILENQVIGKIERHLELLGERRQTLIATAVTGQIDVTTARGVTV